MNQEQKTRIERELREALGLVGFERKRQRRYDTTSIVAQGMRDGLIDEWVRREPVPQQKTIRGDYLLPLLTSVTTGILVGLAFTVLFRSVQLGRTVGVIVIVGDWLVRRFDARRLSWKLERIVGADLDGDGVVGDPDDQPARVRVETVEHKGPNQWRVRLGDLPESVTDDKLADVAQAVLRDGKPFSRRGLAGVLTQIEYGQLYDAMKTQRLVFSNGKKTHLTGSGRRLLERFL